LQEQVVIKYSSNTYSNNTILVLYRYIYNILYSIYTSITSISNRIIRPFPKGKGLTSIDSTIDSTKEYNNNVSSRLSRITRLAKANSLAKDNKFLEAIDAIKDNSFIPNGYESWDGKDWRN
jgi:hypothetical protein